MAFKNLPPGLSYETFQTRKTNRLIRVAFSSDGQRLAIQWIGETLDVYDVKSGRLIRKLNQSPRIASPVYDIALSPHGKSLACALDNTNIAVFDVENGELTHMLKGHKDSVFSVAFSPSGKWLASGSVDSEVRVWEMETGRHMCTMKGHQYAAFSVAFSPNQQWLATASVDGNVRIWEVPTGSCLQKMEGHSYPVDDIQWSPDGKWLASASRDQTVKIWEVATGSYVRTLEGHTDFVLNVAWSSDGLWLASRSSKELLLWRSDSWMLTARIDGNNIRSPAMAFHPSESLIALGKWDDESELGFLRLDSAVLLGQTAQEATIEYSNAKIALIGESGVGKSGLALVLTGQNYEKTDSTHSRHIWTFQDDTISIRDRGRQHREALIWDLAGQPGYRVHHQLHLSEVTIALIVFDARHETDPLAGIAYWVQVLKEASKDASLVMFLVSARTDRGVPRVGEQERNEFCKRHGFAGYFETSAKKGLGIEDLRQAIRDHLPWGAIAPISAPQVFYDLKLFLKQLKENGEVLQTRESLLERYQKEYETNADAAVLETCIRRLESTGLIRSLVFGNWTLLQPELLDQYGAWLAQEAGKADNPLACIPESTARAGKFRMDADRPLSKKPGEEGVLLVAMVEELVARKIVWRQETEKGAMLVFPSELRIDMPEHPNVYTDSIQFHFTGAVSAIYASLSVCLLYSRAFDMQGLYRNAIVFHDKNGKACGYRVGYPDSSDDSRGLLTVFFEADTNRYGQDLFQEYIEQQLEKLAVQNSVQRERIYICNDQSHETYRIPDHIIAIARRGGRKRIRCSICDATFALEDDRKPSARVEAEVQEVLIQSQEEQDKHVRIVTQPEREQSGQFDVFLSFNSADKPDVRRLASRLREEGLLPWFDEERILPGDQFVPELEPALREIPAALVLIGPNSLGPWQEQEYYVLLQRFVQHRKESGNKRLTLIPVLLPGALDNPDVPPFLGTFSRVDFRKSGLDDQDEFRRLLKGILTQRERG